MLVLSSLRTLNTIFSLPASSYSSNLLSSLQNHEFLASISAILHDINKGHQIPILACKLVAQSCVAGDARWQDRLVSSGVLAGLVLRLAMVVKKIESTRTTKGSGLLKVESSAVERPLISKSSSMVSLTPQSTPDVKPVVTENALAVNPASSTANFDVLLDAISVIVRASKLRSSECLFAGWITNILGEESAQENNSIPEPSWRENKSGIEILETQKPTSSAAAGRGFTYHGQEFPPLSPTTERTQAHIRQSYPPGTAQMPTSSYPAVQESSENYATPGDRSQPSSLQYTGESEIDPESSLIPWLIYFVRDNDDPLNRLMAINLLTDFVRAGCVSKARVKTISLLIVPMLVALLDDTDGVSYSSRKFSQARSKAQDTQLKIRERAPLILATLVTDAPEMQKVAVDALAIKRLAIMLKRTFDDGSNSDDEDDNPNLKNELEANSVWVDKCREHTLKVREATLRALAAIALFEDEYRRRIIDSGAMDHVRYSLIPADDGEGEHSGEGALRNIAGASSLPASVLKGNPASVLIAATTTIRSLSRSVHILSTSLIDAKVCEPLCKLLTYPSKRVQIAATAVIANLAMAFSPMRKNLLEKGIIETLCNLVKTYDKLPFDENNEALRLNAMWTLKHIITEVDGKIKKQCLDGLDKRWIIEFINRDPNSITIPSLTDDTRMSDDDKFVRNDPCFDAMTPSAYHSSGAQALQNHDIPFSCNVLRRLSAQWHPQDIRANARKALINLQEQALDFIRNLVMPPASTSMIDQLLDNNADFFEVLRKKLASKPPIQITHAIVYILVNISASHNDHRMRLIKEGELFKELNKLFECQMDHVRIGLTWLAINLTWLDDGADQENVKHRVGELRRLGFVKGLEWLRDRVIEMESGNPSGGGSGGGGGGSLSSLDFGADGAGGGMGISGGSVGNGMMGAGEGSSSSSSSAAATARISMDVRERCKQALKQIESNS